MLLHDTFDSENFVLDGCKLYGWEFWAAFIKIFWIIKDTKAYQFWEIVARSGKKFMYVYRKRITVVFFEKYLTYFKFFKAWVFAVIDFPNK